MLCNIVLLKNLSYVKQQKLCSRYMYLFIVIVRDTKQIATKTEYFIQLHSDIDACFAATFWS